MSDPNEFQELVQTVKDFPVYIVKLLCSLLSAILGNPPITVLALGTLVGVLLFGWCALAIGAAIYVIAYTFNNLANAIGGGLGSLCNAIRYHADTRPLD